MSARFYVHQAKGAVGALRQRLGDFGYTWPADAGADLESLASVFLDCQVVRIPRLSDRVALSHLTAAYGVDTSAETPEDAPLAGGLYVTRNGVHRWIFVEQFDSPRRQRFTIAHELAHLVLDAEPEIATAAKRDAGLFDPQPPHAVLKFGRCPSAVLSGSAEDTPEPAEPAATGSAARTAKPAAGRWTDADLREVRANHFAAELLMPYEGVRRIVAREAGAAGVRTDADLVRIVAVLASTYDVSPATAQLRLTKDLDVTPRSRHPNGDLFD